MAPHVNTVKKMRLPHTPGDVRSIQRSFPLTDDTNGRSDVSMNGIDSGNNGEVRLNENKDVKKEIIGLLLDKMSCM